MIEEQREAASTWFAALAGMLDEVPDVSFEPHGDSTWHEVDSASFDLTEMYSGWR